MMTIAVYCTLIHLKFNQKPTNMDKQILLEKVKSGKYSQEQLLGWIGALPGTLKSVNPTQSKVGDVHMHPIFAHPYVLLERTATGWICTLLTSEETCTEILEPCDSRFFTGSYFTRALFTYTDPQGRFMAPFDNNRQLTSIYKKLKNHLGVK